MTSPPPDRSKRWTGRPRGIAAVAASLLIHGTIAILLAIHGPTPPPERPKVHLKVVSKPAPKAERAPESPPPVAPAPKPPEAMPKPAPVPPPIAPRAPPPSPPPTSPKPPPPTSDVRPPPPAGGSPRSFGIRMDNSALAAPGTGVPVPAGDGLGVAPGASSKKGPGTGSGSGGGFGDGAGSGPTTPLAKVKEMPKLLGDSPAEYPPDVRRLGIQGRVVLDLVVDEEGRVVGARVAKALHPRLDTAALDASKRLRFSPGTVDGQATRVRIPYTYVFVLE